jgi:hypothetical protein
MSRKSTVLAAITMTIVIALLAAWWVHSHSAISAASPTEIDRMVPAKPSLRVPEHTLKTDAVVAPVSQVRAVIPVNDGPNAKRSGAANDNKRPGATGGPFVMSSSILSACNDPGIKGAHICDRLYADLAQIAKEPQDDTWSSDMEEKLQAYVERTFKDASIRNIDCRTSFCAMEVQTGDPTITAAFPYPNPLLNQLHRDTWMESAVGTAPESFVVIYKRR